MAGQRAGGDSQCGYQVGGGRGDAGAAGAVPDGRELVARRLAGHRATAGTRRGLRLDASAHDVSGSWLLCW